MEEEEVLENAGISAEFVSLDVYGSQLYWEDQVPSYYIYDVGLNRNSKFIRNESRFKMFNIFLIVLFYYYILFSSGGI